MKYDRLYNFISPVTGKLPIDKGYILLGDKEGRSFASPVLIDVRQDIIDLRRSISNFEELNKLDHNRIWIGDYYNEASPQLHIGVINLPVLGAATFPYPSSIPLPPIPLPNPTFNPLSGFDWLMSGPWLPQIFAGSANTLNTSSETVISSSLAMTQVRVAQAIKRLDVTGFVVKNRNITFVWDNPAMLLIPEAIKTLYGLNEAYTFTNAQALDEIGSGILKNSADGILSKAISGEDYVDTADIPIGNLVILDPLYPLTGHKLIAPTDFNMRKNNQGEFGYPIAGAINVLTGIAAKFSNLAVTGVLGGTLLKVNGFGEINSALPDYDYISTTLPEDNLFYGNSNDKISFVTKIKLKNSPSLGMGNLQDIANAIEDLIGIDVSDFINIPDLDLPLGKIYRGTESEIPELSNSLSISEAAQKIGNLFTTVVFSRGGWRTRFSYPNSVILSELPPGIMKQQLGFISTAVPGVDYATPEELTDLKNQAQEAANDAADSASDAASAASSAASAASSAESAVSSAVVAAVLTGGMAAAIAAAASYASDAEDSADDAADSADEAQQSLETLLMTWLNITGDIEGTGIISGEITTRFADNPSFNGEFLKIPVVTTPQSPVVASPGMIRYKLTL